MDRREPVTSHGAGIDPMDAVGDTEGTGRDRPTGVGLVGGVDGSGSIETSSGTILPHVVNQALRQSTVTGRLGHDYIQTNEDHLYRVLLEHRDRLEDLGAWKTPLSLFAALVTALVVSDFRTVLGIESAAWQAFFMISAVVAFIWLIAALARRARSGGTAPIKQIVEEIKQDQRQ